MEILKRLIERVYEESSSRDGASKERSEAGGKSYVSKINYQGILNIFLWKPRTTSLACWQPGKSFQLSSTI